MEVREKKDHPKMIVPPPLIFIGGLIVAVIIEWIFPFKMLPSGFSLALGASLAAVGGAVLLVIYLKMRSVGTNIEPWKPTTKIIDTGFYAYSRNPIYIAMATIYLGVACAVNSIWFLPVLPLCLLAIHYGMIVGEEAYLEAKFGDDYLDYKRRVRRWI